MSRLSQFLDDVHQIRLHLDRLFPVRGEAYGGWVGGFSDPERAILEQRQREYTELTGIFLEEGQEPPKPAH